MPALPLRQLSRLLRGDRGRSGRRSIAARRAATRRSRRSPRCSTSGSAPRRSLRRHDPLAMARIDEAACIGCTLCIRACPTDAIVGAAKRMHTVMADHCTGCGLCLPPCPVDCIVMIARFARVEPFRCRARRAPAFSRARRVLRAARQSASSGPMPDAARERAARGSPAAALARARSRRGARPVTVRESGLNPANAARSISACASRIRIRAASWSTGARSSC